ncbi:MAG: hypothetical protein SPK09_04275 [Porphyromonas sp.]|nr:hypothetical protein [Porphyromonas sp.]
MSLVLWLFVWLLRPLSRTQSQGLSARAQRALLIDMGLWSGSYPELILKLSWGLPNTLIGYLLAHSYNLLGYCSEVSSDGTATALSACTRSGAFSIGGYIFGPRGFRATPLDHLYLHEYGHYLQGLRWGIFFLPCIALPSLLSAAKLCCGGIAHEYRWFEVNANRLSWRQHNSPHSSGSSPSTKPLDRTSYTQPGCDSPYPNPRERGYNRYAFFPLDEYHLCLWDIALPLLTFGLVLVVLYIPK